MANQEKALELMELALDSYELKLEGELHTIIEALAREFERVTKTAKRKALENVRAAYKTAKADCQEG